MSMLDDGASTPTLVDASAATGVAVPRQLGRFEVLDRLGTGGMGVVVLARDPDLDRRVALKLMQADRLEPAEIERFRREAKVTARLSHPNVVHVHEVGVHDGQLFVAMEYIDGQTLARWQRMVPRSPAEIVAAYVQAGEGLAAAHRQGIVHRDFKPSNVMVGVDGRVRVLDFGLAQAPEMPATVSESAEPAEPGDASSLRLTRPGTMLGTPAYMSPEQIGCRDVDARSDQFSFCAALFEALEDRLPFAGTTPYAILQAMLERPARMTRSGVPRRVRAAILRGLSIDPAERFVTLDDLLDALRPRRRWSRSGAAVLGLVAAGLWIRAISSGPVEDPCAGVDDELAQRFDDERQAELERRLLATGRPSAAAIWQRVGPQLQAWADEWTTRRRAVCEAELAAPHRSARDRARADCLDHELQRFETLLQWLGRPDPELLARIDEVMAAMGTPAECERALAIPAPPPSVAPAVTAVRDRLVDLEFAIAAGHFASIASEAQAARLAAERTGYDPVIAEALVRLGTLRRLTEADDADAVLRAALHAAIRSGYDAIAVEVLAELMRLSAVRSDAAGLQWAMLSDAAVLRIGDGKPDRTRHEALVGDLRCALGEPDEGRRHLLVALTASLQDNDLRTASSVLAGLSTCAAVQGGRDESILWLLAARDLRAVVLGPDHPRIGDIDFNIAVSLGESGALEAAHAFFGRALDNQIRSFGADSARVGPTHLALGQIELALGRIESAVGSAERAHAVYATLPDDDERREDALTVRGTAYLAAGRLSDGYADHRELLRRRTLRGVEPFESARLLVDLGVLATELDRPAEALAFYEMLGPALSDRVQWDHEYYGHLHLGLGRAKLAVGDRAGAVEPLRRAVAIWSRHPTGRAWLAEARAGLARGRGGP